MTFLENNNIKVLRKKYKITQQELADYLGYTREGYAKNELNNTFSIDILLRLCLLFNVNIFYLLGINNDIVPLHDEEKFNIIRKYHIKINKYEEVVKKINKNFE